MILVNSKEARCKFSSILNDVENGSEIIVTRRGKKVARITQVNDESIPLKSLKKFRDAIKVKGEGLSQSVIQQREEERY